MKVVYTDYIFKDKNVEKKLFGDANIDVIFAEDCKEDLNDICRDADGIVTCYGNLDSDFINSLENCKILVRTGIGYNNIDIQAATEKNIMVANVRDYCIEEVADHGFALMLALIRKLPYLQKKVKEDKSWTVKDARPISRISDLEVGCYALGAIGKDFAKKAQAFGMKVKAYDPFLDDDVFEDLKIEKAETLEDLVKDIDVLSIHAPLNDETRHSVNLSIFQLMKNTAYIINTARGEVINESDLNKAIEEGLISGAGLDVLESENPNLGDPIVQNDKVIITPHIAYYSLGSEKSLQELSAEQAILALTQGKPKYFVNKNLLK